MAASTEGKSITCRAAVLWAANDLKVETIEVAPPKKGEVRVKVLFNALCHTDLHFIGGGMPAPYPVIMGHEATGIVESVGEGRNDNNFCETLSLTNFFADMDDGTSRFTCKGKKVSHFFGTSTFSEYTVVKATMLAKIDSAAPMEKACLVGCGFTTGFGSAMNSAEIRRGDSVAVFGAGCVGLSAMHGAQNAGAKEIFAIDINPDKEKIAREMGATQFVNPKDCPEGKPFAEWYIKKFGHVDRAIECIGNIDCMKNAVYITKPGWGRTVIVGLGAPGKEFSINPLVFLERKTILGSCYGDYRVQDAPKLVEKIQTGAINIDPLITHRFDLKDVNQAVELLKQGKCIRSVISLARHE